MHSPTSAQIDIRDADELSLLVIAPAGCGKTEAIALRVAGLIERGQIKPPQRVLVTTFSNRARDNVSERLREYLSPTTIERLVTVANFHGLSARIFRAHANVLGFDPELHIIPDSDWVGDQCRARNLGFRRSGDVQDLLRQAKQQALLDFEIERALEQAGDPVALEIERLRVKESRLTYDDLPRVVELILQHDQVARLYSSHFACVLVDEFQDLTPQQLRLLNRIAYGRTTYAGDLSQGIYGFAGAASQEVFAVILAECKRTVRFSESHRSSPAVLAAVNALSGLTGGQTLTAAEPERWPRGGLAARGGFDSTAQEAAWAIKFARYVLARAPEHRIGVIARTVPRRRFVGIAAEASGLDFYRWDDAVLDTDAAELLKAGLDRLAGERLAEGDDLVTRLCELTFVGSVQDPSTRQSLHEAIGWCCDLLIDGVSPSEVKSRIRVGDGTTLINAPGLHLLTGHVGKGQQFDWVIVVGAEDGCIPDFRAETSDAIQEEARVFSVMLSRARYGVIVLWAAAVEAATDGRKWLKHPSRFLAAFDEAPAFIDRSQVSSWLDLLSWDELAKRP
jgi:DNA helicase-2/ATP-dependent DNA helicase PcrA